MLLTVSILCVVTFMAGLIDSIAGGGGLLRLPALLVAGVPPQQALGTNKFVGAIGTGAAMLNFARKGLILWKPAFRARCSVRRRAASASSPSIPRPPGKS